MIRLLSFASVALLFAVTTWGQSSGKGKGSKPKQEASWLMEKIEAPHLYYRTFKSATIGQDVSYLIYLPAEYEAAKDKRFPVTYWLHGIGGSQKGVPQLVQRVDTAIQSGKTPPMLMVFVNGMVDNFYCDTMDGKVPVESVIIKDLIPHVDSAYRTIAQREGRIIEGFSMGGFGSAHLGFKYPELFGAISSIDGAFVTLSIMHGRHIEQFKRIFAQNDEKFTAEDPRTLAEQNITDIRGRFEIRQVVGALKSDNESLHEVLTRLDIEHTYVTTGLGHNHGAIYDWLGDKNWEFYRKFLKAPTQARVE